ncbi:fumarylacetoacetate hydrolase family protein [Phyllobacterium chamaecytisi]|uniref:fumarylacetoacetate hydrolase family protein n=1 Tax=Phyllobacterium chamaecytisi TaxID=2876082 RepID=UPI001CCF59D9|nr:fumarylacetoacetate hydrolase family protein [Phyllobacterium sp. KW56]MBZ9603237.1 fumarylacetoacetate hydrolase family protein [Phyllobacterium sp. KW56]
MRYMSFSTHARATWGIVEGDNVLALGLTSGAPATLKEALEAGRDVSALKNGAPRFPLDEVTFLPVLTDPDKIICVGLNYEEHRRETGREVTGHPTLFIRFANAQVGHGQALLRPRESEQFDYEGELALVVGKPGRHIGKERAFDYVAGYVCFNDGSIRDWQRHTSQFAPGKNFAATGGFGPWMVTPDEVGPLENLRIVTRLNEEIVQSSTLGNMIFDIPTIISYCSTFTRLEVGDVIVTGTPGGVGMKRDPQLWMKAGDTVEVEIDRIGLLRNTVEDAR